MDRVKERREGDERETTLIFCNWVTSWLRVDLIDPFSLKEHCSNLSLCSDPTADAPAIQLLIFPKFEIQAALKTQVPLFLSLELQSIHGDSVKMSTIEKLIVQIFERKNSIVEQVKHQIDLYDQNLASRLIIDGIAPPLWLWNLASHSQYSDPTEVKRKELISELLLPRPQPSVPYSTGHNFLYNKTVVTKNKEVLPDDPLTETRASIKGLDESPFFPPSSIKNIECGLNSVPELEHTTTSPQDKTDARILNIYNKTDVAVNKEVLPDDPFTEPRASIKGLDVPTFLPHFHNNNVEYVLDSVPELEPKTTSPQDKTDARILNIYPKPDKSLERFQRSKSRQKALAIRNSVKTGARSRLRDMNDNVLSSDGSAGFMIASLQSNLVNEVELVRPLDMTSESNGTGQEIRANCGSKERDSGRITISRSSCRKSCHVYKSSETNSSSYIVNEDGVILESIGKSLQQQQHNHVNESLKLADTSDITNKSFRVSEAITGDKPSKENGSNGYCGRVTRSRSSCQQFDSVYVSSKLGNSSDIVHIDGGTLKQFQVQGEEASQGLSQNEGDTDFPTAQGTQIRAGSSSPGQKDLELYRVNTRKHESEGNDVDEYVSKSTGSQTSYSSLGMSAHGSSNISDHMITRSRCAASKKIQNARANQISAGMFSPSQTGMSSPSQNDLEMCTMNAREYPSMGNVAHECTSRNTQLSHSTEGRAVPVNSNISIQKSLQSSAASPVKLLDMHEADDIRKASATDVNVLPSNDITGIINHERYGATLEEMEMVPDNPVEARVVSFGSEHEGASPGVGLEALASGPHTDSPMLVKPKQLDFDGIENYSLNASFGPSLEEKGGKILLEKRPSTLLEPVHFTKESSQPRRSGSLATERSWPLYKRRKVEDQLTHVLSVPPSLTVKALQSIRRNAIGIYLNGEEGNSQAVLSSPCEVRKVTQSNDMSPNLENGQNVNCLIIEGSEDSTDLRDEEGDLSLEGRHRSETTFPYKQEQLGPSCSSSLTKQKTGDCHGCLMEELGVSSHTSMTLDVRSECTVEENQNLLHIEIRSDQENAENLTCVERTVHEIKSQMGEDGLLSHCSVGSLHNQYLDTTDANQYMPVLEGFIVETDDRQPQIVAGEDSFHKENLPNYTLERASILEQLCKSASIDTPLSHISTTYKLHRTPQLYQSVPNGLLEHMDLKNTLHLVDDSAKQFVAGPSCMKHEVNHAFQVRSYSDGLTFPRTPFDWDVRNPYRSPIGKLWERSISSNSSCSEKHRSSNPELICFPIAEDPNICEEMGNTDEVTDTFQDNIGSIVIKNSTRKEPLADITECYENSPALVCEVGTFRDSESLDSANTEINSIRTHNKVKQKPQNHYNGKGRCTSKAKENQNLSLNANGVKNVNESFHNRFSKPKLSGKNSLRIEHKTISERESKRNNIVSNIASFVPLVQQKQAAAVITGKRDIKVKALEAAEAAKRLEEKKENERKMKKEAMKLERARLEQENLRQLELKKKKKEEAQKKKDADMAVRKRVREEASEKEKEGKRKRIEEAQRQQRVQEEKVHVGKHAKETQCRDTDVRGLESKESKDDKGQHKKIEQKMGDHSHGKIPETESRSVAASTTNIHKESIVVNDGEALHDLGDIGTVKSIMDKVAENDNLQTSGGYDISPYQVSDDEEEEEDDIPNKKFIPSWASSKNSMALAASSQQQIDVHVIFSPESFCSIDEVLLPRKR